MNYGLISCIHSLLSKTWWLDVNLEERNENQWKEMISKFQGANCKYSTVDSNQRRIIGDYIESIGYNWKRAKISQRNEMNWIEQKEETWRPTCIISELIAWGKPPPIATL